MGRPAWIPPDQWALLVQYADQYNTYPEVFAAIGWWETHWGQLGAGRQGYILGVGVPNSSTELPQYQGLEAQLAWTAPRAGRVLDRNVTYAGFLTYARTVQKPSNPVTWAQGVWAIYQQIGGPVGQPAPTQPPNPQPSPPPGGPPGSGPPAGLWLAALVVLVGVVIIGLEAALTAEEGA